MRREREKERGAEWEKGGGRRGALDANWRETASGANANAKVKKEEDASIPGFHPYLGLPHRLGGHGPHLREDVRVVRAALRVPRRRHEDLVAPERGVAAQVACESKRLENRRSHFIGRVEGQAQGLRPCAFKRMGQLDLTCTAPPRSSAPRAPAHSTRSAAPPPRGSSARW